MPVRLLSLILVATFTVAAAQAQSFCDGKYDTAQEILDAAYGKYETLYSGGDHWHRLDDVGATLDLYRMWGGLPDQHFRDAGSIVFGFNDNPIGAFVHDPERTKILHGLLLINEAMTDPRERELTDVEKYKAATLADLYTSKGPESGWWVQAESSENLTITQLLFAQRAQSDPGLEWLQMTLEASYARWTIAWHLVPPDAAQEYAALHEYAAGKYLRDGGIEWAVAAFLFLTPNSPFRERMIAQQSEWISAVDTCEASDAEFAAAVVSTLETLRLNDKRYDVPIIPTFVQGEIRKIIDYNRAAREVLWRAIYPWAYDDVATISLESEDANMRPVFNAVETYFQGTVNGLIEVHEDEPLDIRTIRALNLLSVDNLAQFVRARDMYPDEQRVGLQVVFLRYVALGRDADALELLEELTPLLSDQAPEIAAILASWRPRDVKLALVSLALPYRSVWWVSDQRSYLPDAGIYLRKGPLYGLDLMDFRPVSMDLPLEFRTAQILQRDLEAWLLFPQRWRVYSGLRGNWLGKLDRLYGRGIYFDAFSTVNYFSVIPDRPIETAFKFNDLIVWSELVNLAPTTGLSRRISEVLVNWVDSKSNNRVKLWMAPADEMANILQKVVYISWLNETTADDELHLGQRAFQLLQLRFPETEAAIYTRYWYRCSSWCEE